MQLQRTVLTSARPEPVFAYLSDLTTTREWDPATVRAERLAGAGGTGTTYLHVSSLLGREIELTCTVVEHSPPSRFALRGESPWVAVHQVFEIRAAGAGTLVTGTTDLDVRGVAGLAAPLLRPALALLADDAEQGLADALGRLARSR